MAKRYWISRRGLKWEEVSMREFVRAEREAGFFPKHGRIVNDDTLSTGGFYTSMAGGIEGKITRRRSRKKKTRKK